MIIIWDCKSGRREFIEMALKTGRFESYTCASISDEDIELVKGLEPKLIISCCEYMDKIQSQLGDVAVLELGKDIALPINPLALLDQLKFR